MRKIKSTKKEITTHDCVLRRSAYDLRVLKKFQKEIKEYINEIMDLIVGNAEIEEYRIEDFKISLKEIIEDFVLTILE